MKHLALLLLITLALVACGDDGNRGNGNNGNNEADDGNTRGGNSTAASDSTTVLMNSTDFIPETVTIPVDTSLTLQADGFMPHYITNGTWQDGNAVAEREDGAPEVNNLEIQGGDSGTIGPFTETGTFQFYCTIHPNMNLTVTVE